MAINTYISEDGTAGVKINTKTWKVSIIDNVSEEIWLTPIGASDGEALDGLIVPGFKNGKIMMWIAKKIKEALT